MKLSSERLETEFRCLLKRLRPSPEVVSDFPKIAAKVWSEKYAEAESRIKVLASRLVDQRRLKSELLKKNLRGGLSDAEYNEVKAQFDSEITATEGELESIESSRATTESFVQFAELLLVDIARAWEIAGPEQRQRVQNLLFDEGLAYSPESGILNRSNSSLFSTLEGMIIGNGLLASPTGFEPVLSP